MLLIGVTDLPHKFDIPHVLNLDLTARFSSSALNVGLVQVLIQHSAGQMIAARGTTTAAAG
jgi:hypothetical protein